MLSKEHIELFNRYLKKDLTEQQLTELKEILKTPEGKLEFSRFMEETGVIIHTARQTSKVAEEDAEISKLVRKSEEKLLSQLSRNKESLPNKAQAKSKTERPKTIHFLYLGFLGAAAALLFFFINPGSSSGNGSAENLVKSVARVTSYSGGGQLKKGDWLVPGDIEVESGNLEITFDSGAVVLMQGRSSLRLETAGRAFLNYGKVSAKVPEEAIGFIINTPQGTVVDLGTEFAVNVDEGKGMEVHVIEGEVEAGSFAGNELKLLKKDESLRIENSGQLSSETTLTQSSFSRVPEFSSDFNYNYIHWPFDKVQNGKVLDEGNGGLGGHFDLRLPSASTNIKPGKIGSALSLSGKKEFAESSFAGIGSSNPRTVAFWVKIPPDSVESEAYAIVSWGKVAPSQKWQVGYNANPANGVVGAIRTEFSLGYVIGTTDLRDGRWHHVVSMFVGGKNPNVATHVRHYIDGKLEGVSGFRPRKINTNISDPDTQPVFLGKYINHDRWYFRGKIDEFYIFDGALTPHQISLLKKDEVKQ
ncbi:MAG: FecR domain-containing protein [Lentisphaeraceae bacterium]|nr:FecR domain-containing protein [Lentisphaeraceae bacterium]